MLPNQQEGTCLSLFPLFKYTWRRFFFSCELVISKADLISISISPDTFAIRFQGRTDGGFPELDCGIKVLRICYGAFFYLFDQINPVGQLDINAFQAICPALISLFPLLAELPAWVSSRNHLRRCTGCLSSVSYPILHSGSKQL